MLICIYVFQSVYYFWDSLDAVLGGTCFSIMTFIHIFINVNIPSVLIIYYSTYT